MVRAILGDLVCDSQSTAIGSKASGKAPVLLAGTFVGQKATPKELETSRMHYLHIF